MNVFIDEVIKKLLEIRNDGYLYCDINVNPADKTDDEDNDMVGFLSFEALDCGGLEGIDYADDPDDDVTEVPDDELQFYAHQNMNAAPNRKPFKKIDVNY